MKNPVSTITKIYGPVLLGLSILSLLWFIDTGALKNQSITVPIGLLSLSMEVSNSYIINTFIIVAAFIPVFSYLVYDFSKFFPDQFELNVYFDIDGIERALAALSQEELKDLKIPDNYNEQRQAYYKKMDNDLATLFSEDSEYNSGEGFYSLDEGRIRGEGYTSYTLSKISGGFQHYRITESKGLLKQSLEREGKPNFYFESHFELYPSSTDIIKSSLHDIYIKKQYLLAARFKQIFADRYDKRNTHHLITSVVKVYFFPYPQFSDIVYLWEYQGQKIPVAYAVAVQK